MVYYAKSRQKNGKQPIVKEHNADVSVKAKEYGEEIGLSKEAETAGLLHDFGKYSGSFQGILEGTIKHSIDHAVGGALYLYSRKEGDDNSFKGPPALLHIMEAIRGHHDGLVGWDYFRREFYNIKNNQNWQAANTGKRWSIQSYEQYQEAQRAFKADFPEFRRPTVLGEPPLFGEDYSDRINSMLYTRMLFSCLVDADYSVSAHEADSDEENYFETSENTQFDVDAALQRLTDYRNEIRRKSTADGSVNAIREQVYDSCGKAGEGEEGLYTLTAPTGTGKTLALLHFALKHCQKTGKRRIILVLPFLTLAEQNTEVYRNIIPDLLTDHSQSNLPDSQRELAARWRTPFIITTSVKFFESLFAAKPTDCRKLHNIANSVVVFDEAQSLPANLTVSTLNAVRELCSRWHVTMLFSTATQPDFDAIPSLTWNPVEILPDGRSLYQALKRTSVEWRIGARERLPLSSVASEMAEETNVCAIVNLRKHAVKLFEYLKAIIPDPAGLFMISTDLCPAHRQQIVEIIRERQENRLPCYVVSTQCIEAGVDLDFDTMFRALAPLEAIIQAAGRCNRNGRNPEGGRVIVFVPDEDHLYPDGAGSGQDNWYGRGAETVQRLCADSGIDIHNPDDIARYYRELFGGQVEKRGLVKAIESRDYADTDKQYRLIENGGVRVLIPYAGQMELYEKLRQQMLAEGLTAALMREAAPITVATFEKEVSQWCKKVRYKGQQETDGETGWYVLDNLQLYYNDIGLQFNLPSDVTASNFSPLF